MPSKMQKREACLKQQEPEYFWNVKIVVCIEDSVCLVNNNQWYPSLSATKQKRQKTAIFATEKSQP